MNECNYTSCKHYIDNKCDCGTENGCSRLKAYQQGKEDTISEMRKLEQEHYCPYDGTDCCYKYSDESCLSCYLDKIEGKE